MYVDLLFLLLIYVFSVIALAVSFYALWTLKEIESFYRQKSKTTTRQPQRTTTVNRPKSHWD